MACCLNASLTGDNITGRQENGKGSLSSPYSALRHDDRPELFEARVDFLCKEFHPFDRLLML